METEYFGKSIQEHERKDERALLGSIFADNSLIETISPIIRVEDLADATHREIWGAMQSMYAESTPIDLRTLSNNLKGSSISEEYLSQLTFYKVSDEETVSQYAKNVRENSRSRNLSELGGWVDQRVRQGDSTDDLIEETQKRLDRFSDRGKSKSIPFDVGLKNLVAILDNPELSEEAKRIPTGWDSIDYYLDGGLQLGNLDVVAGRTGMGKTSFATNLMYNVASTGAKCLMISIEMPHKQIMRKLLAGSCKIPEHRMVQSTMEQRDWDEILSNHKKLQELPIHIDDTSRSLFEVMASIRSHVRKHDVHMVFIDYVQRIKVPNRDMRYLEVGEVVDDLADLAKRLQINIVLLSQINRGVEMRTSKRPLMSDLSVSGKFEEAASRIFLIYRDEVNNPDTDEKGIAEINLAKNRFGRIGIARMAFLKEYTLFGDL